MTPYTPPKDKTPMRPGAMDFMKVKSLTLEAQQEAPVMTKETPAAKPTKSANKKPAGGIVIKVPDGYLPWFGGSCPVTPSTVVSVVLSNGTSAGREAKDFNWQHYEDRINIIGYRTDRSIKPALQLAIAPVQYDVPMPLFRRDSAAYKLCLTELETIDKAGGSLLFAKEHRHPLKYAVALLNKGEKRFTRQSQPDGTQRVWRTK